MMQYKTIDEIAFINPDSIKKGYPHEQIEYIDISSVGTGHLIESKLMSLADASSRAKRLIKDGDTILSTVRPNRRSFLFIKRPKENIVASTGFVVLRAKNGTDSRYLYYSITDQKFTDYLTLSAKGAAYPAVDTEIVQKGKVPYWPTNIQRKISSILAAYDDLIENNTHRIQILEEMAQRIYQEWFVNFRFPGHEKLKFVDSEMGKIPEGWGYGSFFDMEGISFISGNVPRYQGDRRYFATADVNGIDFVGEGIEYEYSSKPSRAQKQPILNSVWFARMKDTYKVLVFTSQNHALANSIILSSGFAGFEAIVEDWLSFLFVSIKSPEFHQKKDLFCTGATQMALTNDGLGRIEWLFPTVEVAQKYNEIIKPMIDLFLAYQHKNRILRKSRDILLPKLISGEIDVSEMDIVIKEQENGA